MSSKPLHPRLSRIIPLAPASRERKENSSLNLNARPSVQGIVKSYRIPHSRKLSYAHGKRNPVLHQPLKTSYIAPKKEPSEFIFDASLDSIRLIEEEVNMTDMEKQNAQALQEYGPEVEKHLQEMEKRFLPGDCLAEHDITPTLRAKMIDWMIEVLTNFKCREQTFFLAVGLMDRYFREKKTKRSIGDLHIIGVTAMFLSSKNEDILPLRMDTVYEKIAHRKLSRESILESEHDMLTTLGYLLQAPTVYEFISRYLHLLDLPLEHREFISCTTIYLAKLCQHDYSFCNIRASKFAMSAIFASLKICEQLYHSQVITVSLKAKMNSISGYAEQEIAECAQKVLMDAQNFDTLFPGLANLKKTNSLKIPNCIQK